MKTIKYIAALVVLLSTIIVGIQQVDAKQTFKDVSTKYNFYNDIEWAVSKGLLKGYDDGTFRPSNYLAEAHFAKIFTRYAEPTAITNAVGTDENTEVYDYLTTAGIILPGHASTANRSKSFTRIQVAKVFYQFVEGKAPASNNVAIDWMYAKGLTTGKGVSSNKYIDFGSEDPLKRAHISAFFYRLDNKLNKEPVSEATIVDTIAKDYIGSTFELIDYDRINLTTAAEDEYFLYLRDKKASLVDQAENIYIVASYDKAAAKQTLLKKWSQTGEYSFLERVKLNTLEQMIIYTNAGSNSNLQLSAVAANSSNSVVVTDISKTYPHGSFTVDSGKLVITADPNIHHTYKLSNGKLVQQ